MLKYIIRRLLVAFVVVMGVVFITFTLNRIAPADPVISLLGSGFTQEQYDAAAARLGVDKPYIEQLGNYYKGIFTELDLGTSYQTKRSVTTEISGRFWITIRLGLMGVCLTLLLGIPIGVLSAVKQYSFGDYLATFFAMLFASMPNFWFALLLMLLFALKLKWFPASGLDSWKGWVLPVTALGLSPISVIMRTTRSSMLDVVRQDYITTARSKGLSERKIIFKHELRNALIPIVTIVGGQLGHIIGGAVVVESIFTVPGRGLLMLTGVNTGDYPVVQGCVLIISASVCVMNIVVDIAYAFIDPRLKARYGFGEGKKKKAKKAAQAAQAAG